MALCVPTPSAPSIAGSLAERDYWLCDILWLWSFHALVLGSTAGLFKRQSQSEFCPIRDRAMKFLHCRPETARRVAGKSLPPRSGSLLQAEFDPYGRQSLEEGNYDPLESAAQQKLVLLDHLQYFNGYINCQSDSALIFRAITQQSPAFNRNI
jgi:hypothetical protein